MFVCERMCVDGRVNEDCGICGHCTNVTHTVYAYACNCPQPLHYTQCTLDTTVIVLAQMGRESVV